jgi:hypothetical protein
MKEEEVLEMSSVVDDDVLSTPELETPPAVPDAHRGVIDSVSETTFETGTTAIVIGLRSLDTGAEQEYKIFPPQEFVTDFAAVTANPASLSDAVPAGKKQSPKQRYAAVVANSDKDAELQRLRAIAAEAGRTTAGLAKPTTFAEFIGVLNTLLSNVEVIFTRTADEKNENPAYRKRLNVNRIHGPSILSSPKALKKYKKAWELGTE